MFKLLTPTASVLAALLSVSALAQTTGLSAPSVARDPCVKLRIALDIGSGATKIRSAVVDACKQTILAQVYKTSAPLPFKDNLAREGGDKITFEPEFLKNGVDQIAKMLEETRTITKAMLANPEAELTRQAEAEKDAKKSEKILRSVPKMMDLLEDYAYLANVRAEVAGVATEAFRQADDTRLPEDKQFGRVGFGRMMREKGINHITVLSQAQEGHVGFIGVMADPRLNANPKEYISWDIGGASLQIVGYKGEGDWQDFGNHLASNPMREFVMKEVLNQAESPNPILKKKGDKNEKAAVLARVEAFVTSQMAELTSVGWLNEREKAQGGLKVYGIGGVHGGVLSLLQKLPAYKDAKGYTVDDLRVLLDRVMYLNDEQIAGPEFGVPVAFTKGTVSNVLIVYSVMKVLGISSVQVADVDNSLGTMVSFSSLWKPVVNTSSVTEFVNP